MSPSRFHTQQPQLRSCVLSFGYFEKVSHTRGIPYLPRKEPPSSPRGGSFLPHLTYCLLRATRNNSSAVSYLVTYTPIPSHFLLSAEEQRLGLVRRRLFARFTDEVFLRSPQR